MMIIVCVKIGNTIFGRIILLMAKDITDDDM